MARSDASVGGNLEKRVESLLNGCIGANPLPGRPDRSLLPDSPLAQGLIAGLSYAFLFCLIPVVCLQFFEARPERHLFLFSVYGSLYFAWATIIARLTSIRLLEIVRNQIVPTLSPKGATQVHTELEERFNEWRIGTVSWAWALLGTGAAAWAIYRDVGFFPLQIFWWSLGWLMLFLTAARTTFVGRFYSCFAKQLDEEEIYALDPAQSILVQGVAALGQAMLVFWFGILLSITLLIPFASLGDQELTSPQWYAHLHSAFVWLVVPVTSLFSIPFGTLVYLNSEKAIRKVVTRTLRTTKLSVEQQVGPLFARYKDLGEADLMRVNGLSAIYSRLATSGGYKSALAIGFSLLIPLIGPATAVAKFILDHQKH
ncbi:hypothetical protein [Bradyrhizobium sp. WU425]|uniref:hypothetical protein n=1 Tax=Bradyrhizobium sp. WU425 TaxID=187029 RepID=UPI001E575B60|nr:hypothetical protein [Bradyrhizobium canariense]UFW71235.1 hypothetical protein BcanWU425_31770 [Bradyrhizobium canariense]